MTHTPAVDSLEHIETLQEMLSHCEPPYWTAERAALNAAIAALTRSPGGSERLRESLRDMLELRAATMCSQVHPKGEVAIVNEAKAALASPQGAEQRQELTVAWLVADLRNEGFDAEASMIEGLAAECAAEPHSDTPGMAPDLFNRLANGMREFATPYPEPAAQVSDAMVLVPRKPTEAMLAAVTGLRIPTRLDVWNAMIEAAHPSSAAHGGEES